MKNYVLLILVSFLISCSTTKLTSEISIEKLGNPPGTEQITENVYLDKNNISNVSYREFLYWINRIYGGNSQEYISVVPDTTLLNKSNNINSVLGDNYFRHPKFQDSPVMGVSINQAKQYSKWRSDRVMEWTLVKYGIIKMNNNAPKDSIFTIEKYFSGKYYNIKPSPYLLYYPEYQLIDSTISTVTGFRNICTYKKWK
ncbi:MAG: SUMF1/EgtB/PvdO family nonheme iron enzyme [Bacteroidia bacterium]|nr:SUMF1/EgtB/PvdO family nonheme iron enzyme [Bacteroidia bacterium]